MDEQTALDDLRFIRQVMDEGRRSFVYNGKDYIFWGVLVFIGMISTYLFHMNQIYFNYFWIWVVLIPIGWAFSIFNRLGHKIKYPSTFAGRLCGIVWGASGVAMTIIGFLGTMSGAVKPMSISPLLSIIMGSAYFITGKIINVKWIGNLSYGWWLGGILLFYVTGVDSFLIMGLMMMFFQTIPGLIMYRQYKQIMAAEK